MPYAVLLDTVSIQSFIFSTNNLKENLGASQLVKEIYEEPLFQVLREFAPSLSKEMLNDWKINPEREIFSSGLPFEIGYIGGGNALIFFEKEDMAKDFIKKWSLRLLTFAPSLTPASAVGEISFDEGRFANDLNNLFKKLTHNKSNFHPLTVTTRHGINAECRRTGLSKEVWAENLPFDEKDYISAVAYAKIEASKRADKEHENILREIDKEGKYCFTSNLEELGQIKGEENYIAIVHIDGNDMAKKFKQTKNIFEKRILSRDLAEHTYQTFKEILVRIIEKIPQMRDYYDLREKEGKIILPIRPIIIGGDDITFVCDGRLGIWLAKTFLEIFQSKKIQNHSISACAGISITKTKYPFYRGYQLSEELLRNAKNKRKEEEDTGSWLDFHLSYGGFSGRLNDIRKKHYRTEEVDLLLRPFKIEDLNEIIKATAELLEEDENGRYKFPRSKLHKLREALYSTENERLRLLQELKIRGLRLPRYKDFDGERLVIDKKTPYYEMIELTEMYPKFAFKEEKDGSS
ncbi:MAG: hypothetical protein RMI01_07480 [Thermodesulfovibrio sp.]|nr:hypothetical protein [Thermodesulfovibrio sp.]